MMQHLMIWLCVCVGAGLPVWYLVYPRPDEELRNVSLQNLRRFAVCVTIVTCGFVYQAAFFLSGAGYSMADIVAADVGWRSGKQICLIYFLGAVALSSWLIYACRWLGQWHSEE